MKIDLHLHTTLSKNNGDVIIWNDLYDSFTRILANRIKMASFTDHNIFDAKFYLEAKQLASTGNIVLLPGIEVNVVRKNGVIGHMVILFREDLNDLQLKQIENIKILKNNISLSAINDLYSDFETIRIIHIGKEDYFSWEDLENLKYDAFEITNFNHSNYKSVLKKGYQSSVVAFSDTHLWNKYPQNRNLITNIEEMKIANFDELKRCLSLNKIYCLKE